jgi:hypothetical protein
MSRIGTQRAQWLSMLAKLTSPMESTTAAQAFAAYAPFLERFPDAAFTAASLEHVASKYQRGGIPTYGDVREHLGRWWKDNRPMPLALPKPEAAALPPRTEAESAAARWSAHKAIAHLKAKDREYGANDARDLPPPARHLTRTELDAAYAAAGITGPKVAP